MLNTGDIKVTIYLASILAICLTPLFLFKKRWDLVAAVAAVMVYFIFINRDFIWGSLDVWHDGMADKYFMAPIKQWLDNGISIGWNPYMNGGEPLYLILNGFLFAPWIIFCVADRFINVGPHILYHLFWVFIYLNFCVGSLLLFLTLFKDLKVAIFCFITLILSGQFKTFLGQPGHLFVLYYFPYILFGFIASVKYKSTLGALFSLLFFGLASNLYMPHYIFLGAGIFIFFILVFHHELLPAIRNSLIKDHTLVILAIILFLMAAAPTIFLYCESKKFQLVKIEKDSAANANEFLNADFSGYRSVLLGKNAANDAMGVHVAFYAGVMPLLLLFLGIKRQRNGYVWPVLLSGIAIALLGKGFGFMGFTAIVKYLPTFYLIRHSWLFSQFTCFYLILLSGYGLQSVLEDEPSLWSNFRSAFVIIAVFLAVFLFSAGKGMIIASSVGAAVLLLCIFFKTFFTRKTSSLSIGACYLALLLVTLSDLGMYHTAHFKTYLMAGRPASLEKIKYPMTRSFYTPVPWPALPDFSSVVYKVASVTARSDDYVFFRDKRFAEMLRRFPQYEDCAGAFGVGGPIFYFTPFARIIPEGTTTDDHIKTVFGDFRHPDGPHKVFLSPQDIDFKWKDPAEKSGLDVYSIEYTRSDNPNRIEATLRCGQEGFLVRLENFNRYWKARLDGLPVRIYRANYAFQAIMVPSGTHKIVMKFESPYPVIFWSRVMLCVIAWIMFSIYISRLESPKQGADPLTKRGRVPS